MPRRDSLPLYAKLSPSTWDVAAVARAVEAAGADGLSLVNTMRGMKLDADLRPVLGTGAGGLSGPALKPVALAAVYACRRATRCRSSAWAEWRRVATRSSCSPPAPAGGARDGAVLGPVRTGPDPRRAGRRAGCAGRLRTPSEVCGIAHEEALPARKHLDVGSRVSRKIPAKHRNHAS